MASSRRPLIGLTVEVSQPKQENPRAEISHSLRDPYVEAVLAASAAPLLIPAMEDAGALRRALDDLDGVLFIGGDDYPPELWGEAPHEKIVLCHPLRTASDLTLAREVEARRLPVLGICGGAQLMAVAAGGAIVQHLDTADCRHLCPKDGQLGRHDVRVEADSQLAQILGNLRPNVNSSHHQAVSPTRPGQGLRVVAWAVDDEVVEAIETDAPEERGFCVGVQWHPERDLASPHSRLLFDAFAEACRRRSG